MINTKAEIAYKKGYRIFAGHVISKNGKKRKLYFPKKFPCYPRFTIYVNGKRISVKCHHLAAWQKFGKECLGDTILVRHLDDDNRNFKLENIELGTAEDNMEDKYSNSLKAKKNLKKWKYNLSN